MQESEYMCIQIIKIIKQEISFASRYIKKRIPRMQVKNTIKTQKPRRYVKNKDFGTW